jgi:acetyl esterase/lipase
VKFLFLFSLLIQLTINSLAQHDEINLYPNGKIILNSPCGAKEKIDTTDEGRPRYIHKVTEPKLWFYKTFKPNPKKVALLVLPGGGFGMVSIENEGRKVAERFQSEGFDIYVLKYRTPSSECQTEKQWAPLSDAMTALELIRKQGYEKIGVVGFSAGGHLGAQLATLFDSNPHVPAISPPDFCCLVYPVISMKESPHEGSRRNLLPDTSKKWVELFSCEKQINAKTPPVLLIHSIDDEVVSYQHSELFFSSLLKKKVHAEIHLFPFGGHAFGIGKSYKPESPEWINLAVDFFNQFRGK